MQCEVWSVECEDFASSLAEKIKRLSSEGHGRDRVSLNYRSFMFGKLPPPACPGLCYIMYVSMYVCMYVCMYIYIQYMKILDARSTIDLLNLFDSLENQPSFYAFIASFAQWFSDIVQPFPVLV